MNSSYGRYVYKTLLKLYKKKVNLCTKHFCYGQP